MSQTGVATMLDVDVLRSSAQMVEAVVKLNLEGLNHADSLKTPSDGNCANWVLGHMACVYNTALPLIGQQQLAQKALLERYRRGSEPLSSEQDSVEWGELLEMWNDTSKRFKKGLDSLSASRLEERAPFSPTDNPNETVRSLLTTILFHQAYHTGQLGLLRRVAGKDGAIK